MTDGVVLNPGVGGATVDTETNAGRGGAQMQRFKLVLGDVDADGGDVAADNPLPISAAALPLPAGAATAAGQASALTSLGTLFQAGQDIGNTQFGAAQIGTWTTGRTWTLGTGTDSVAIGGTLPAFAATPTVNLGQGSTTERTAATSITTGGTAQLVEAAIAARVGFTIQNTSTGDLWFSTASTTPSAASPTFRLPSGQTYQTPENWSPTGAFYIYGATTGQTFTYRSW